MSYYFAYYVAWIAFTFLLREPWLLIGIGVFLLLRRWIPDPSALLRAFRRAGSLRKQVDLNPHNVTARRDLAMILLDLRRPRAALALVEQALARTPNEGELLYMQGLALHRLGRHQEALAPLERALQQRATMHSGAPRLVAGNALLALGRTDEAIETYRAYAESNHSDIGVHLQLAKAYQRAKDAASVRQSLSEAQQTWSTVPRWIRRQSRGRWFELMWLRARLLGDMQVISVAAAIAIGLTLVGVFAAPAIARFFSRPSYGSYRYQRSTSEVIRGFDRCGTQRVLARFEGRYRCADRGRQCVVHVKRDRILLTGPSKLTSELCVTHTREITEQAIRAAAVYHEDVADPGDASMAELSLQRQQGNQLTLRYGDKGQPPERWVRITLAPRANTAKK
jgi:tetratricopeptide (TPR) repeat protein